MPVVICEWCSNKSMHEARLNQEKEFKRGLKVAWANGLFGDRGVRNYGKIIKTEPSHAGHLRCLVATRWGNGERVWMNSTLLSPFEWHDIGR